MQLFDFNAVQVPTWAIKLADTDQTVVHLVYPTLDLVDRLMAMSESLQDVVKNHSGTTIQKSFDVVAAVLSCNDEGLTFTAEDLRDKYHMTLAGMVQFTVGYLNFLAEANQAKN